MQDFPLGARQVSHIMCAGPLPTSLHSFCMNTFLSRSSFSQTYRHFPNPFTFKALAVNMSSDSVNRLLGVLISPRSTANQCDYRKSPIGQTLKPESSSVVNPHFEIGSPRNLVLSSLLRKDDTICMSPTPAHGVSPSPRRGA